MAVEFILLLIQGVISAPASVVLDSKFHLGWSFSGSDVSMTFNCFNIFSWCGLDFTYGMEKTEMIVALSDNNQVTVTDYYSKEFTKPTQVLSTFTVTSSVSNSSGIFVTFTRPLNTGNKLDQIISPGLKTPISFAYLTTANKGFERHNNIGEGLLIMGVDQDHSIFISGSNIVTPMIQLDNNFTFGWDFTSGAIYFYFNCYNIQGWCGVTFIQGMQDTEMIIAYNNNSIVEVTDYYSFGYQQPENFTGINLQVTQALVNNSGIFATFSRPLTGNLYTQNFSIGGVTYLSFAYLTTGGQGFIRHNRIGKGTLVTGSLQSTSQFVPNAEDPPVISLDNNFTLSWQFLKNFIVFTFSCQNMLGWCGVSFVHGMENTELIVLQNINSSYLNLTDYYSTGYHRPNQTTGTSFSILSQEITPVGFMASFSRLLSPGGLDQSLAPGQCQDFSYAYLVPGEIGFRKHNYTGIGALTFGVDSNSAKWLPDGSCLATVSFDQNFSMSWVFSPSTINITFNCYNIFSWCGVTFVHGMNNTEMIILLNNAGTLKITDYYSTNYVQPVNVTGSKLTLLQSSVTENGIFATFSRPLNQNNTKTTTITPGMRSDFGWAYLSTADQGLQPHNNKGIGLIIFGVDANSAKFIPGGSNTPYVTLDNNFNLGWSFTDSTIDFKFDCFNIGSWCGISFIHGMVGTEMIVALYNGEEITVTDYYSTQAVRPTNLTHMPLFITNSSYSSAGLFVEFSRPLGSISPQTVKFFPGVSFDFSFAYLTDVNQGFQHHNHIGTGLIKFGDTASNSFFQPNGSLPEADAPYFRLVDGFYLGWQFGGSTITFTFNCFNIQAWCGISFGGGMHGLEMIIVQSSGDNVKITDYYSYSNTKPSETLLSLTKISGVTNKTGIFATFSRPLSTSGKAYDLSINSTLKLGVAYRSSGGFSKHNKVTSGNIKFGLTNSTSSYGDKGDSESIDLDYYRDHGVYMSVMWIGVSQAAIIVMRYFKWWTFSGLFHTMLGTTAVVVTLVSSYKTYKKDKVAYKDLDAEGEYRDFLYHSRIAFTMCGLVLTQFFLGVFFKFMQIFKKNIKINNFSRLVHRVVGWTLPVMGLINIKFGWHLHGQSWKNREYIYPMYGVLCCILFLFEMNFQFGGPIRKHLVNLKAVALQYYRGGDPELNRTLVTEDSRERRRHCEVFEEIMNNRKDWVFYDEFILDIAGFKWNHPGGSFVFKRIAGQDVGKFLNGGSNIDDNYRPYFHSNQARNIAENLAIGYISFPRDLFLSVNNYETMSDMKWNLTNRTFVAKGTYCLEFSSYNWEINEEAPGYDWIGKHFLVTSRVGGKILNRYYSFVLVNLASWADEVREAGMQAKVYDVKKHPNKLRLHMKHYPGGLMTDHLSSIPLGTQIQFKGPIGPGICTDSFKDKEFLVFGAGTGVLPFLDLVYAIWKGRVSNSVIHMYMSFRDDASSFAVDLVEATAKHHPRNLKLYTRIGQKGFELHAEFWRNMLPLHLAEKAWICGPPVFNRKIEKILIDEGFNPGKILLL